MKEIPIAAAKEIAEKYDFDQIIIIGRKCNPFPNAREHCTTYGVNEAHCKVAAQAGDFLKYKVMKWAEEDTAIANHIQKSVNDFDKIN